MPYVNNKGADQPAISAFVVHCLDSIIPLVSISKISSLYLASVAAQVGWVFPGREPWRQVQLLDFLLQHFRVGLLLSNLVLSQWWILIYMFAVLIHWWVEVLYADRTTSMCIWTTAEPRVRLLQRKTGLSPQVIYYWPFHGVASVVVYSNCQYSSAFCLSLTFCK